MDRALRYKTLFLAFLVLLGAVYLAPTAFGYDRLPGWFTGFFDKRVKLGLDLQGGLHIVYGVDLDKAIDDKAGELRRDLEAKLAEQQIDARIETPRPSAAAGIPLGAVFLVPKDAAQKKKIDGKFFDDYADILTRIDCPSGRDGVCLRVSSDYADRIKESAITQAIRTIKDRVDALGVADPTVVKKGEDIVVELPGTDDKENERIRGIIDRTAQLEFKINDDGNAYMQKLAAHVESDPAAKAKGIEVETDTWNNETTGASHSDYALTAKDRRELVTAEQAREVGCSTREEPPVDGKYECLVNGRAIIEGYVAGLSKELQPPEDHELGFEEVVARNPLEVGRTPERSWRTYYLHRTAELTGTAVSQADVVFDPTTNRPEVRVEFNRHGARRFGDLTSKNVGRKMAILLDDKITSAPVIQTAITGGVSSITMGGGDPRVIQQEAEDLVNVLRTGALPAPLVEKSSSQIGALLGQDAIDRAQLSMVVGAVFVVLIMLYFYRVSGVIANVAMLFNILFQIAVLAALQAVLTLPGIAGIVLTIGMAVDSNIIIYERIREELRTGKTVRGAVDAGFNRAFWTVFDAHVTNFVAGFVLMEFGTGPIRGFAVMLLIGVVVNLFTSTWASRLMFDLYLSRRRTATTLSI